MGVTVCREGQWRWTDGVTELYSRRLTDRLTWYNVGQCNPSTAPSPAHHHHSPASVAASCLFLLFVFHIMFHSVSLPAFVFHLMMYIIIIIITNAAATTIIIIFIVIFTRVRGLEVLPSYLLFSFCSFRHGKGQTFPDHSHLG